MTRMQPRDHVVEVERAARRRAEPYGTRFVDRNCATNSCGELAVAGGDARTELKRLRQKPELASLVVVMVTTETELGQMTAALEAGANEYIMKPFTKDILVEKLQLVGIHP